MKLLRTCLAASAILIAAWPPAAGAAPECGEPPETVGNTIFGTPCDDVIRPPRSITTVNGEGGNDTIFGGRGNDRLFGNEGDDALYGGIGDDQLRGGIGNDRLSGGFGADSALDGEAGDDFVRGDATIDQIDETGAGGTDTLSYATGATPGFFDRPNPPYNFPDFSQYVNFPTTVEGRGAYINLATGRGDNGRAPHGGGFDEQVSGAEFEVVIGTAFPDYIVGTSDSEVFYGGGGADVIIGGGGNDTAHGGAEGDSCSGATMTALECETSGQEVQLRDPGAITTGLMAPGAGAGPAPYLGGSDEDDEVTATYAPEPPTVTFTLGQGSAGAFDASPAVAGGCNAPAAGQVVCPVTGPPDSIVLAGLGGDDTLTAADFPDTTSVVLLGGAGGDDLLGGATEDAVVDGPGDDLSEAAAGDDAVPNNEGADDLHAGSGEDLFVSDSICEGDVLDGGPDRDNANWANFDFPIVIDLAAQMAALSGPGGQPDCGADPPTDLEALEDIEGSDAADVLVGDGASNQLLGRRGADSYFAAAGDDSILANSGTPTDDPDSTIDCGEGFDTAQIDHPENGPDPAPINCESVEERDPNSFRPPDTPPGPEIPVEQASASNGPPPVLDRRAPRTRLGHRPPKIALTNGKRRRVVFYFAADEPGARFRCRLDRRAFASCRSPRAYAVGLGSHTVRVFSIDAAGNNGSAARYSFRVRRR